jgi:hypothetical protein
MVRRPAAESASAQAGLREIEVRRRLGELVEAADVRQAALQCGDVVLRALDRIAAASEDISAAAVSGGPVRVRGALRAVIRNLRATIGAQFERLAAGGGDHGEAA